MTRGEPGGVRVLAWPDVRIEVDPALERVGVRAFRLYDVSDAEVHVFAEAEGSRVERLLWLQVERVLPTSDHAYDYSRLPLELELGRWTFRADARAGAAYSVDSVDPEGDVAQVLAIVGGAGLKLPDPMLRLRFVAVDETGKQELLGIYLEALEGVTPEALEEDEGARTRRVEALVRSALETLDLRPGGAGDR